MAKKTKSITFKVEPEVKESFLKTCEQLNSDPSHELRQFVHRHIKLLHTTKQVALYSSKRTAK